MRTVKDSNHAVELHRDAASGSFTDVRPKRLQERFNGSPAEIGPRGPRKNRLQCGLLGLVHPTRLSEWTDTTNDITMRYHSTVLMDRRANALPSSPSTIRATIN